MHQGTKIVVYEDLYGDRTNVQINNMHAIVDFQVSYQVDSSDSITTNVKDSRPFTSVSIIYNQYDILTLDWADGDQLTATVKAIDILDKTNQETIVVYRDATPPIVENVWLTKGDRLNVSVHILEDFTKMTIEWEAYDVHSGLDSVYWRLFDSKTGVLHGHEDIIAQGHSSNLTHCEDTYSDYARGANCYCTPFQGCFHRHFQIKPEIKQDGGLIVDKDKGTHEYDYFIEISVTSIAQLTTVLTRKITVDISPPHPGAVYDGQQGNPEIDYQQGMDLHSYWDQFFDRESGVFFYQYIVNTTCADKTDFVLDGSNPNIVETYNNFGSHTVSGDGTYYFTVVAYNRALDPSEPVCSDGVTIDSSVPGVKEVVVKDSLITGGVVKDPDNVDYYILGPDRVRRLIPNPTADCITKATALNSINLFPLTKTDNGSIVEVDGNIFCINSSSSPSVIGLTLFKSSLLEMSWEPLDIPAKIFDYEVGFSSTAGSSASDIMAFQSTKQHAHARIMHTNIPDGTQFYILIKTISKSNVEGLTTLGPCFMDTTPPEIVGGSSIFAVQLSGDYLVTTWPGAAVSDSEELFTLDYQFAVGHSAYGTDVQGFQPLQSGGNCTLTQPPSCTVVKVTNIDWFLHGHHTYYVSLKVTNTAGQTVIQSSGPYIHDVQLPAEGVVLDIDTQDFSTDIPLKDIQDLDFQTSTSSIAARWSGFAHPHLDVTYSISIGTTMGGSNVVSMKDVGTSLAHQETGLSLTPYQKYYLTVTAVTTVGNTAISSDGVTVVTENDVLSGVSIYDGEPCNMTDKMLEHHMEDHRLYCSDDVDIQMSTNSLKAYWTVPDNVKNYTPDAYIAIEKTSGVGISLLKESMLDNVKNYTPDAYIAIEKTSGVGISLLKESMLDNVKNYTPDVYNAIEKTSGVGKKTSGVGSKFIKGSMLDNVKNYTPDVYIAIEDIWCWKKTSGVEVSLLKESMLDNVKNYTPDAYIAIEKTSGVGRKQDNVKNYPDAYIAIEKEIWCWKRHLVLEVSLLKEDMLDNVKNYTSDAYIAIEKTSGVGKKTSGVGSKFIKESMIDNEKNYTPDVYIAIEKTSGVGKLHPDAYIAIEKTSGVERRHLVLEVSLLKESMIDNVKNYTPDAYIAIEKTSGVGKLHPDAYIAIEKHLVLEVSLLKESMLDNVKNYTPDAYIAIEKTSGVGISLLKESMLDNNIVKELLPPDAYIAIEKTSGVGISLLKESMLDNVKNYTPDAYIAIEKTSGVGISLLKESMLDNVKNYTPDAYIAIEKTSGVGNQWSIFRDFLHVSTMFDISIDDLTLNPGIKYRIVLKLCAKTICFSTISTDGVMVMTNSPVTGDITVEHLNTTQTGGDEKLMVSFAQFYDPDIEDLVEKYDAVDKYEFAITDNSVQGKTYMVWTRLDYTAIGHQILFEYVMNGTMDFSRCKRFSIRGYNKAKQYSTLSTEIKDCQAFNPILIHPNIVIDAVGAPDSNDGIGRLVYLEQNALWPEADSDYTPYKNVISAVWPTLRHKNYDYAVLEAKDIDVTTYYRQVNQLNLKIPCDHPDRIKCGHTENGFINVEFTNNELVHGTRYTVCVHAAATKVQHETWIEDLPEISSCSDGVIVDLTPPVAGRLWIGTNPGQIYQTTITDLYVKWDGFHDVEEYGVGPHSTGIQQYILGIGTTSGGNDVHAFENIGVVQHKALPKLNLPNGYRYYATLKAVDFANRETQKVSAPITIDYTPPERNDKPITLSNRHITSTTEISPCWTGVFIDLESGIDYYLWSVGSEPGYTDMMPYLKVVDEECGMTDKNNPLDLKDSHFYYINVRAFNKAGLSSLATSWTFQVDTMPPTPGHLYDGDKSQLTGSVKDIDYQTDTKVLYAHWEGFHESHSTIKDYYVSVGTCPQCEDILQEQAVGITYDFTLENIHLGTGLRYYTTVTACNTADMCTTVTSDGVIIHNSPPTAGAVQDGTGFYDTEYQSMMIYISAKWYGFDDPQSGLQKYVWRAGTKPGYDDIVPPIELHLTVSAALLNSTSYNLDLPLNKRIYVTVRAYNKLGLWSESSSNGFIVDNTPPVMLKLPTFSADFGIKGLTQINRTSVKVEWAVDDDESFIKRQYLSIKSHIGGEFMLSSQSVNGIARSYVFTGLDLHDGVTYYVTIISCNSAEICITSTSQGLFVDSTPPSRGTFAVATDHAVNPDLARNEKGWMTWGTNAVYLAWLGFSDIHSKIDHYMVTVGSSYMAKDLTKDHTAKYIHVDTNTDHGDEGKVQLYKVETQTLTNYDELFVTVWAVNKVGLRSHMVHSAFTKTPPSSLDLVRRCDSLSCDGHCVCAPQDQRCPYSSTLGNCTDVSDSVFSGTQYTLFLVKDTNGFSTVDQAVTASNNVLRATWQISQIYSSKPKWYEWSVGYADRLGPEGIFDPVDDKVWQDAGQLMDAVFTIGPGKDLLKNTLVYSVYVKVWYSSNIYAVFKTNGIYVMTQAPVLATVRGTAVTEKVQGTSAKDDDYMKIERPITYTWKNKFLNAEATIEKYRLYLSSFPGGYDILTIPEVIPGTATGYNMSRINLIPGVRYYSNVIAYNYAGVHTTSTSDGFIVDHVDPSSGIVYDGLGILDLEYQNSTDIVAAHWHGFVDTELGILSYYWCVGETTHVHRIYTNTECSVLQWTNVGLHTSTSKNLSIEISQGLKIYSKVYAIDSVGRRSSIIVSDGVMIDVTPPIPEKFIHASEILGNNTSFENTGGDDVEFENITFTDICMVSDSYHPLLWIPSTITCMAVVSSDVNLAKNGRSFLFIRGNVYQQLDQVRAGYLYKVSFFSSHLPITDSVGANKEGFVQLDDVNHVFLIYTKPYHHDGHGQGNSREKISWHTHTFYFKATNDHANITIGSIDMTTGIFLDDLSVQEVNLTTGA
ncbi:unnamed protein product [Mytilus coruscus]|uniref:Uncharacterized protein n=1 Tax=Mytilus coruscus TaxID=42192 RepID=A0A6J8BSJ9_MYTCO|nr:unnamed protein product [Mytilus coruscus]